jgi:SOS-response transcriptional repressor LexA
MIGVLLSDVQYAEQRRQTARARAQPMSTPQPTSLDPRALGQRIASLRHANGWSQRRLADAAGVSHGYIALLELGRLPSPGKFRLDAVARALNLRTSDALTAPALSPSSEPEVEVFEHAPAAHASPTPPPAAPSPSGRGRASGQRADSAERPAAPPTLRVVQPSSQQDAPAERTGAPVANVVGRIEQLRSSGARPLPVFRWGACGDPRDQESGPDPDRLEYPPPGRESLIGPAGFGVVVKGDSMAGRGIFDGDVVWVNPERPYAMGKVVLALVSDVGDEPAGMVVKTYARTEVGDCLLSETAEGRSPVVCREFKVIGPVVGITSWRLPS